MKKKMQIQREERERDNQYRKSQFDSQYLENNYNAM